MPAPARLRSMLLPGIALGVLLAVVARGSAGNAAAGTLRPRPVPVVAPSCPTAAPTTAAGYARLFAQLPTSQWGAADLAVTVPVDGRSVWLFGDTMSSGPTGTGRFVHSTAIVQRRGCLHVSNGGAQLLPDGRTEATPTRAHPSHIYWIVSGRALTSTSLEVTARSILVFGTGAWDFEDGGVSRAALVDLDPVGDLTLRGWLRTWRSPPPDAGALINCDAPRPPRKHHFCYARHVHPELRLAGGQVLVTVAQNWDDGTLHRFADYRPLFQAVPASSVVDR
ncbi:MAG TPA: hypothetical protein VGN18_05905 [Jatrophihabitans sp.]|jgi:hypothetical protein|uniref:hypothetical protein n=1 Tax=Jatrophihabitans sp. TaxID=1932789 RepID=UPI002DF75387|nr:hypothetical protein [Jatrophihabitans sp.]